MFIKKKAKTLHRTTFPIPYMAKSGISSMAGLATLWRAQHIRAESAAGGRDPPGMQRIVHPDDLGLEPWRLAVLRHAGHRHAHARRLAAHLLRPPGANVNQPPVGVLLQSSKEARVRINTAVNTVGA
jgi:hypothetical protein